jgi:hypothetical protein
MPRPLLNAALGVAMALCSARALAGEAGEGGTFGFIAGGGQGGDLLGDKNNYYYAYLGGYYETRKLAGPLSWRFGALALNYSGIWFQGLQPGQESLILHLLEARLITGPSLNVSLPGEWWLWSGLEVGLDFENETSGRPQPVLQNELMFGRGFFSSYLKIDLLVTPDAGLEMRYLQWQISFRLLQWLAFGPELRFQTAAPSVGLMVQVGDDRPRQYWNVTAGGTFDEKVGGQWHLDLWWAF